MNVVRAKRSFGQPFTQDERRKAVELYSRGLSLAEVATELRRSPSGIYNVLLQESCPVSSNKRVTALVKTEIVRLYYEVGLSSVDIAGRIGIAKPTVLYWLG